MKLYKNKNHDTKHFSMLSILFALQVLLGVVPAILFMVYVLHVQNTLALPGEDFEAYSLALMHAILFISVIFLSFTGYTILVRKYNILISGERGERALLKIAKKLKGNQHVFMNLPIRYKNNRSEIDLLVVSERGIISVEVKNHSGAVMGSGDDDFFIHRKFYRKGKITETEMKNPFKQVKRQREILKNILRSNGINVWIDSVIFFSGNPTLKLDVSPNIKVATSENEMFTLINEYITPEGKERLTTENLGEVVKILRGLNNN
ncbi:MAG: NERD domain-containing protein [Oscillospiraceae bacterium]|nr:NERD domain-containing protein [Oscillospiraceae bacterium]